ncbi:eukaryotic translation initiation factor 4 gamma 1-like [Anopheles funestus]|uniref:MIF4G domain-containing protein n=1 Tax=Anopheles funestus TaxID=62324 RepID=A0A182RG28_ANOFN|nr:eukaryotic translation initiation factor 4 gamma 1-like [Anopheles funestus]XP_049283602.1 eukaryotic translation initiation factor 4 gamma 1-like [Anopheles funestus]XP_049283603.1 eukaryotic translation initiation factor 4 gamma 1-like [Anopheles funestus]XP_049283604.1 eukaryotic translation initiation factor 4 gamma 1-like [Anopheles funestus]
MATDSDDVATLAQSTVAEKRQEEDNNNKIDLVADTVSKLSLNGTLAENGENETVSSGVSEENQLNNNSTTGTDETVETGNNNSSEPPTPTTPTGGVAGPGGPLSIGKRIRRTSEKLNEDAVSGARKKYSLDLLLSLKDSAIGREKPTTIPDVCKSLLKSSPGTFVSSSRHMGGRGGGGGGGVGHIGGGQDNSLLPSFMKGMGFGGPPFGEGTDSGSGRPPMNRAPYRGRLSAKEMSTRSSAGGPDDTDWQMIKVNLNITEEVKLKGSANAWKPSFMMPKVKLDPETEATQLLSREFRSALNKLTPENFSVLKEQIKQLKIDTEERLSNCIKILFEKAIMEPNFSDTYAQLCKDLGSEITVKLNDSNTALSLKRLLIKQCQVEFEKHHKECKTNTELQEQKEKLTEAGEQTAEETEEMKMELEEQTNRIRRRALGTIRFIGALYKQQQLGPNTMVNCVDLLLQDRMLDEESLECVCKLLTTIGARIEDSQGLTLQTCFDKLQQISERKKMLSNGEPVCNRIRFMIMDLLDLRKDKWRGKHAQNAPKTREQIQREVEAEENKNWMLSYKLPRGRAGGESGGGGGGGGSGGGGRDGAGGGGGGSASKNKRLVDEDGFVLPANNRNNNAWTMPSIDPKKINLPVTKAPGETRLGSASMFQGWGNTNNVFAALNTEDSTAPPPSFFGASGPMGGGSSGGSGSGTGSGSGPKPNKKGGGGGGGNNSKKHYQGRSSSFL